MKIKTFQIRRLRFLAPLMLSLACAAAWFFSPALRLAIRGTSSTAVETQLVSAHRYDSDWFDAARIGRIDILGALLDAGYPMDATTSAGYTATILAAYDDQPKALDFLLGRGADPCVGDRNGNTALMGALYKGHTAVAHRLLTTRCPIDQTNNAGETALSFAVLFGRLDFVPLLIQRGADPTHRDRQGDTAFGVARRQGNDEAIHALRQATDANDPDA